MGTPAMSRRRCGGMQPGRFEIRYGQLWADAAYRGAFARWVTAAWGWTIAIGHRAPDTVGFAVQPQRWVEERTFG